MTHPQPSDDLLTTQEVADLLGVKPGTVRSWRKPGRGPGPEHVMVGIRVRYRRDAVESFAAERAK